MEVFSGWASSIQKLAPKGFVALFLFCAAIKLLPAWALSALGISALSDEHSLVIGLGLLISGALIVSHSIFNTWEHFKPHFDGWVVMGKFRRHLSNLASDEKILLRRYLEQDQSTISFPINSGAATSLSAKKLIFRSSNIASHYTNFPYTIQPGVREILENRPSILD